MSRKTTHRAKTTSSTKNSAQGTIRRAGGALYGDVMGIAGSLLRSRKEAGAEKINSFAGAARNFAVEMTASPNIQTYVDAAAEQMESLADYVQDNTIEQMGDDAVIFARRHPMATIAFAVAAGFGFTRLLTHGGIDFRQTKSKATKGTTRSRTAKSAATNRRTTAKVKANGRAPSHDAANAS
jgi:hypothetical protein